MPNIFDGLNKLSNEEIINEIAVLETVNRVNVSKPMFQKALRRAVNIINYVGNKFGKDPNVKEPNVKEIWTMLEDAKEELRVCTREQLYQRLKEILIDKSKIKVEIPSEDELSIAVLEECCKLLGISPKMMPSVKADIIYKNSEKLVTDADIIEDKEDEELEDSYDINDDKEVPVINGQNISILKLGKKFDRTQLIRFVSLCVRAYGKSFSPCDIDMPSYVNEEKRQEVIEKEKAIKDLRDEIKELKLNINDLIIKKEADINEIKKEEKAYNKILDVQNTTEKDIKKLNETKEVLSEEKEGLTSKISALEEERLNASLDKLDEIMEVYEQVKLRIFDINSMINSINHEVVYKEELIENCKNDCLEKEKLVKKIIEDKENTETKLAQLNDSYNEKKEVLDSVESRKKEEILEKWRAFYSNFTFDKDDLNNIVKYNNSELVDIEKCLYELNETKDPEALSNGIVKDGIGKYEYIEIINENGFRFEVWYEVFTNTKRNIHIKEIIS